MKEKEYVEKLISLARRKTFYRNKYPYNLGLVSPPKSTEKFKACNGNILKNYNPYEMVVQSFDCSNLVKALVNGYDINKMTVGYFQRTLSATGDCTEKKLLEQCTDISSDFSKLGNQCRLLYMSGHIGTYLGVEIDGIYNVVECTSSEIGNGVCFSWVDKDGTRRLKKGGAKAKKSWSKNGLMTKWLSYEVKEEPKPVQNVYYVKKGDTLSGIAKKNGMSLAKLVSYNPQIKDINKINIGDKIYLSSNTSEEYYIVKKGDTLGSIARKYNIALNKLLGLNPDIKNANLIHIGDKIRVK